MTASHSDPADGFDREAFRTALIALLDQARRADVDLEGAYNVRTPLPDQPDHTVEISKLQMIDHAVATGHDLETVE